MNLRNLFFTIIRSRKCYVNAENAVLSATYARIFFHSHPFVVVVVFVNRAIRRVLRRSHPLVHTVVIEPFVNPYVPKYGFTIMQALPYLTEVLLLGHSCIPSECFFTCPKIDYNFFRIFTVCLNKKCNNPWRYYIVWKIESCTLPGICRFPLHKDKGGRCQSAFKSRWRSESHEIVRCLSHVRVYLVTQSARCALRCFKWDPRSVLESLFKVFVYIQWIVSDEGWS